MGRVEDKETGDQISPELWNRLMVDYLSQTETGTQSIGGIVYIGRRTSDPDTTGWGEDEKGYLWFNLTEGKYKYWNGAAIVAFPSTGGAGAPVDASYVTINAEAGLTAEIQHANIADEAQKHTPKIHTHVEADITDLDHDAAKIKGVTVDDSGIGADKYLKYDGANVSYATLPAGSSFKLAPDYTVYKVGATYYAMDEDGDTSINGNDCSTVVSSVVAALTAGGWIHFKGGITYDLDTISFGNLPFYISGWGATLRPTANDKIIFDSHQNEWPYNAKGFTVEGIRFETNSKTGCTAIRVGGDNQRIHNCISKGTLSYPWAKCVELTTYSGEWTEHAQIHNCAFGYFTKAIVIDAVNAGAHVCGSDGTSIRDSTFEHYIDNSYGIFFEPTSASSHMHRCVFDHLMFWNRPNADNATHIYMNRNCSGVMNVAFELQNADAGTKKCIHFGSYGHKTWDINLWVYEGSGTYTEVFDNDTIASQKNIRVHPMSTSATSHGDTGYLSGTFAIDAVASQTVTITHGLDWTPDEKRIQASIVEDTDVDDWAAHIVKIYDVGAATLKVMVNVLDASATGGATAKVVVRITG